MAPSISAIMIRTPQIVCLDGRKLLPLQLHSDHNNPAYKGHKTTRSELSRDISTRNENSHRVVSRGYDKE